MPDIVNHDQTGPSQALPDHRPRSQTFAALALAARQAPGAGSPPARCHFPAPIYAKRADAYNKVPGAHQLPVGRLRRGHQADQDQDGRLLAPSDMPPLKDEDLAKDGLLQFPTVIGGGCLWSTS